MPEHPARFASLETPIGRLWLSGTYAGLLLITRADDPAPLLGELSRRGYQAEPDRAQLADATSWLTAYFDGSRTSPSMRLDTTDVSPFDAAVYHATIQIPYGETASYGDVAGMAGSPRAARAVGRAMSRCPLFPVVPCHRVIHADGSITGWGRDLWIKRWLLELETR